MRPEKIKSALILGAKYLVSLAILAVILGPVFITFFTSVKTQAHMATVSPLALPPLNELTWANYEKVLTAKLLGPAIRNTALITVVSVVMNILLGSVTAYSLQRFNFKLKALVMACFYLGMLVAPIIIYVASDLMQLYLYMQFVSKIPAALDESALIDGCGYFGIFYRIIFPLLMPATATVAIIKIVNIVNDMYVPYLYMPKTKLKTLTTFLMNYASAQQGSWPTLAAAIVVVLVPPLILYILFHRQITEGLSAGATKE